MIILSVLVVCHNQCDVLERCIDSILAQKINGNYEIIISDDRSSDGSWDIIQNYTERYPNTIYGVKCNSDECNPVHISERCGWNKRNAMLHCHGKYMVNIDADDFLLGNDIYQKQLDMLEAHPECSMCMQKARSVPYNKNPEDGVAWPVSNKIYDGNVLTAYDIIVGGLRGLNQTYMIRRRPESHPEKYGKLYDDTVITLHHLQYGPVVTLDCSDYVWIKHPGSITASNSYDDNMVIYATVPLIHTLLIPTFAGLFMAEKNNSLYHLVKSLMFHPCTISKDTANYLSEFNGFIFRICESRKIKLIEKARIFSSYILLHFTRIIKIESSFISKLIFSILVSFHAANKLTKEQWAISK